MQKKFKMVNTFLTHESFSESAENLDTVRLGKQRVEAYQILNILNDLHFLASYYKFPKMPFSDIENEENMDPDKVASRFLERAEWVKRTRKLYLSMPTRLVKMNSGSGFVYREVHKNNLPVVIYKTDSYVIDDDDEKIKCKKAGQKRNPSIEYDRKDIVIIDKGEWVFNLGFSQHAVVRMWVGFEESLKRYIRELIKEWVKRGNRNELGKVTSSCIPHSSLEVENVTRTNVSPWWTRYKQIHFSHRASLLRKEMERDEKKWYAAKKDFTSIPPVYMKLGYIWTGNLSHTIIAKLLKGKDVPPEQLCVPITSDSKPKKSQAVLKPSKIHPEKYTGNYLLDQEGYVVLLFKPN